MISLQAILISGLVEILYGGKTMKTCAHFCSFALSGMSIDEFFIPEVLTVLPAWQYHAKKLQQSQLGSNQADKPHEKMTDSPIGVQLQTSHNT